VFGGYVSHFKHYDLKISKFLWFNYEVDYSSSINKVVPYDSIEFIVRDEIKLISVEGMNTWVYFQLST
jgi:hypothetical protein